MDRDELEALERARLRSLVEGDLATATRLHADDYQLITPGGHAVTKAEYLEMVGSDQFTYLTFEPASPAEVRLHPDVAILRYRAAIEVREGSGSSESGIFWHTDVWERRDEGWQAVWSHATRIRADEPAD